MDIADKDMTDEIDRYTTTKEWIWDPKMRDKGFGRLLSPDEDEELFNEDDEPDNKTFEGYTGNAGPTLDYFYRQAAIVFWPLQATTKMLTEKFGLEGAVRSL